MELKIKTQNSIDMGLNRDICIGPQNPVHIWT